MEMIVEPPSLKNISSNLDCSFLLKLSWGQMFWNYHTYYIIIIRIDIFIHSFVYFFIYSFFHLFVNKSPRYTTVYRGDFMICTGSYAAVSAAGRRLLFTR